MCAGGLLVRRSKSTSANPWISEYRGNEYRNLQLNVVGDTLLFRGIDAGLYDCLPDSGPLDVSGSLDTLLLKSVPRPAISVPRSIFLVKGAIEGRFEATRL